MPHEAVATRVGHKDEGQLLADVYAGRRRERARAAVDARRSGSTASVEPGERDAFDAALAAVLALDAEQRAAILAVLSAQTPVAASASLRSV